MLSPTRRVAVLAALAVLAAAPCFGGRCSPSALAQDGAGEKEKVEAGTLYHFGVSAARTSVLFESDTELENIHGITNEVSGTVRFDWDKGEGRTKITVPVAGMKTGLDLRDQHMRSDTWLDAEKYPDITFESGALKRDEKDQRKWTYEGSLTIHGVTKTLKGEAQVSRFSKEQSERLGPGEWARVKTSFEVNLDDFDIKIPNPSVAAKVNKTWSVRIDLFGTTEKPKK